MSTPARVTLTDDERALIDWRESIGVSVFHAIAADCHHEGEAFGDGAVCQTCWDATQRACRVVEGDRRRDLAARETAVRAQIKADADCLAADALAVAAALVRSQGEERVDVIDAQKRHLSAEIKSIHTRLRALAARISGGQ